MMADRGFKNGLGIDMQDICIEICQERLKGTGIKVKNIGINEIGDTFNLVIMSSVLEHIEDDQAYLHIVNALVNRGGYFLFTVPGDMRLYGDRDISYGHYRRYEKEELVDKFEASGFQIDTLWSYGPNFLSKIYRSIIRKDLNLKSSRVTSESTGKSALKSAGFQKVKKMYPFYLKLMFIYKFQLLFLNANIFQANYAGLCRKI
jgi:SAM-dependent methyltransferase